MHFFFFFRILGLLDIFYYTALLSKAVATDSGNRILIRTSTNAVQMTPLISAVVCMDFTQPFSATATACRDTGKKAAQTRARFSPSEILMRRHVLTRGTDDSDI